MGLGTAIAGFVFIGKFSGDEFKILKNYYPNEWIAMCIVGGILNLYNCHYYVKSKSSSKTIGYVKYAIYLVCTIIGLAGELIFIIGLQYANKSSDLNEDSASIFIYCRNVFTFCYLLWMVLCMESIKSW